jgi:hypothetical protein
MKLPILLTLLVLSGGVAAARMARPPALPPANCNNFQGGQTATFDDQYFTNMTINVSGGQAGINSNGHRIHVDTVKINHSNGSVGILITGSGGSEIHNANIYGANGAGANIACRNSAGIWVTNTKVDGGERGIEINSCSPSVLQHIEGSNQTGVLDPTAGAGAFVQWLTSNTGLLEDFYNFRAPNGPAKTGGDVVNAYQSTGITVRHGTIDGVYGGYPSDDFNPTVVSCGVQNDQYTSNMNVSDVNVFHAIDGGLCAYGTGGTGNKFTNVRASNNICSDPVTSRPPASGVGYMFVGHCTQGAQDCQGGPKGVTFSGMVYANWLSCPSGGVLNPAYPNIKSVPVQGSVPYTHITATNICQ